MNESAYYINRLIFFSTPYIARHTKGKVAAAHINTFAFLSNRSVSFITLPNTNRQHITQNALKALH